MTEREGAPALLRWTDADSAGEFRWMHLRRQVIDLEEALSGTDAVIWLHNDTVEHAGGTARDIPGVQVDEDWIGEMDDEAAWIGEMDDEAAWGDDEGT